MTTFEVSNLGRFGYMGGRGGSSLRDQSGAMRQAVAVGAGFGPMGASEDAVAENGIAGPEGNVLASDHIHGPGCKHGGHAHSLGPVGIGRFCGAAAKAISGPLMQLLGLDRFTKGKALGGMKRAGRDQNPFDMGFAKVRDCFRGTIMLMTGRQNCQDFWIGHDDVDYTRLHEIPPEGESRKLSMLIKQGGRPIDDD